MEFSKAKNVEGKLAWVDWMKSIGFYFIVLGHFFSIGDKYVYVFNVPLFFVISGFLCKRESSSSVFWKKLWYNLIVPMVLICVLNFAALCVVNIYHRSFQSSDILLFILKLSIGMNSVLLACWFVYTLIILKIVYHYLSGINQLFLVLLFVLAAYIYNGVEFFGKSLSRYPNSIANAFVAYPFFAIGLYLRQYKTILNCWNNKTAIVFLLLLALLLIYVCGSYNGYVMMFACGFGSNFLLFILGGLAGVCAVFSISKLLNFYPSIIKIVSTGSILILGFHMYFVNFIRESGFERSFNDYIYAAIVVLMFIPLIVITKKLFPIMLGKYRVKGYKE